MHIVLADAIDHVGDAAIHFTTETFLNEVGGTLAKLVTIPLTTGMKLIGLENEGNAMKGWIDSQLKSMSENLGDAMQDSIDLYSTLFRDPGEFVNMIESNPLLLSYFFFPVTSVTQVAKFTWAED